MSYENRLQLGFWRDQLDLTEGLPGNQEEFSDPMSDRAQDDVDRALGSDGGAVTGEWLCP